MRPDTTSPEIFIQIAQEATDADRFVDAALLRNVKRNHNFLCGRRLKHDRLVASYIDAFSLSPISVVPSELCFSAMLPLSLDTREIVVGIRGNGDLGEAEDVRIYPFIVPSGAPPKIDLTRYVDLSGAAVGDHDITLETNGAQDAYGIGFGFWIFGIAAEMTLTNTVLTAASAVTGVNDLQVSTATAGTAYEGHAIMDSAFDSEPRRIVSDLGGAPLQHTYTINRPFTKRPAEGSSSVAVYQVLHGTIFYLTIREAEIDSFAFEFSGVV